MELIPFEKITNVPDGQGGDVDIINSHEFIDIADLFILGYIRGIRQSWYTGLSAYVFSGRLAFGFDEKYKLIDVEFRLPFNVAGGDGLFYNGINLFQPTLLDIKKIFENKHIDIAPIDVGLEVPSIGLSFFSKDYEGDFNVKLDAVTIALRSTN